MTIYLVRHAQTEANKNGIIQGQMNTEITEEGLEIARKMASSFSNSKVTSIFSSPIKRAFKTAELIGEAAGINKENIITDARLMEIDLAPWVYKKIAGLDQSDLPSSYKTYKSDPTKFAPLYGESLYDVRNRVSEFYKCLVSSSGFDDRIVVVSHSVAIRTLLSFIEGKDIDCIWGYHIPPASISLVIFDGEKSALDKIGLTSL